MLCLLYLVVITLAVHVCGRVDGRSPSLGPEILSYPAESISLNKSLVS